MTSYRTVCDVICAKNTHGIICDTEIYEEMFDVNGKIAQTKFIVRKSSLQLNCKLQRISGRFHSLIWRLEDTVQNLESPGLSGRVDSTVKPTEKEVNIQDWGRGFSPSSSLVNCPGTMFDVCKWSWLAPIMSWAVVVHPTLDKVLCQWEKPSCIVGT